MPYIFGFIKLLKIVSEFCAINQIVFQFSMHVSSIGAAKLILQISTGIELYKNRINDCLKLQKLQYIHIVIIFGCCMGCNG